MGKLFAAAFVVLLALVSATGAARPATRAAAPLMQVTPNELRLREPLAALAAEQGRAAFAFCNQLVGVWRPGGTVTRLGPAAQWACPPPRGLERVLAWRWPAIESPGRPAPAATRSPTSSSWWC